MKTYEITAKVLDFWILRHTTAQNNLVLMVEPLLCGSVSAFGVSAQSMQCSYDRKGNSVPTILLLLQERLYDKKGLRVCCFISKYQFKKTIVFADKVLASNLPHSKIVYVFWLIRW